MITKEHLTQSGLEKILSIKGALNWGNSELLTNSFPSVKPIERPSYIISVKTLNPYWVAGFTSGEGCFDISVTDSRHVGKRFRITQHVRDEALLVSLISYFGCGNYSESKSKNYGQYKCSKFSDVVNNIIPFFKQYPVLGVKAEDFKD